jgi:hypothetical protein
MTKKDHGDNKFIYFSEDCTMAISMHSDPKSRVDFRHWDVTNDKLIHEYKKSE